METPPLVPDLESPPTTPPGLISSDPSTAKFETLYRHCGKPEGRSADSLALPMGVYPMNFDRSSTVVLMDSMESVMIGNDRVMETSHVRWALDQYTLLFSRLTSNWQRVVYLPSPDAAFWDIIERERFDWARDRRKAIARSIGIMVIDSTSIWEGLRPYRDPKCPRRAAWVRDFDLGPSGHWLFVTHVVFAVARYV